MLTATTNGNELLALYGAPGGAASDSVDQEFLALAEAIPGQPGEDYPVYSQPPDTSFSCGDKIEVITMKVKGLSIQELDTLNTWVA